MAKSKVQLLDQLARDPEERLLLARLHDKLDSAARGAPACSGFLSQSQQEDAKRLINAAGHPRHLFFGGFEGAERQVCAFLPDWQEPEDWTPPFTALRCRWQSGDVLTHRDILGAIMGQGLDREKVGDILVGDGTCDLLVFQELIPYLTSNFLSAGRVRNWKVEEIQLSEIVPPVAQVKVIHDTVSSPRFDAVLASGFSLARGKASALITSGKAELNHKPCVKSDRTIEQGDVITCRGLGKCVLTEVGGLSKKGRTIITIERYL